MKITEIYKNVVPISYVYNVPPQMRKQYIFSEIPVPYLTRVVDPIPLTYTLPSTALKDVPIGSFHSKKSARAFLIFESQALYVDDVVKDTRYFMQVHEDMTYYMK